MKRKNHFCNLCKLLAESANIDVPKWMISEQAELLRARPLQSDLSPEVANKIWSSIVLDVFPTLNKIVLTEEISSFFYYDIISMRDFLISIADIVDFFISEKPKGLATSSRGSYEDKERIYRKESFDRSNFLAFESAGKRFEKNFQDTTLESKYFDDFMKHFFESLEKLKKNLTERRLAPRYARRGLCALSIFSGISMEKIAKAIHSDLLEFDVQPKQRPSMLSRATRHFSDQIYKQLTTPEQKEISSAKIIVLCLNGKFFRGGKSQNTFSLSDEESFFDTEEI